MNRLPVLFYPRWQCPSCGCVRLRAIRGKQEQGDLSCSHYAKCLNPDCGQSMIICQEVSTIWNAETGEADNSGI